MILILTNSQDATANYLLPILDNEGLNSLRLDTDTMLSETFVSFKDGIIELNVDGHSCCPNQISHLWYRRPERLKLKEAIDSPESSFAVNEWSEALEGFLAHIPRSRWVNHPAANVGASNKIEQLLTAKELGFSIPATLLTQDASTARDFAKQYRGMVIAKPLSNGYIERESGDDSLIYTNIVKAEDLKANDSEFESCPTLFQQFVSKECDVRITVIDDLIHAVELRASGDDGQQRCDIRRNNMIDVAYSEVELPSNVILLIRRLMNHYGLRFAAIDMAIDSDGNWIFFETNPNGQWAWMDISGGLNIAQSFVKAFKHV